VISLIILCDLYLLGIIVMVFIQPSNRKIKIHLCIYIIIMPRDLKNVIEGLEGIKNKAAEVVLRRKEEDNMVDVETGKVTIPNIKHFYLLNDP
jgi:hypothetical protein